jgi:hypothetical protein
MSKASWLVSGAVPGVERQPLKKLDPDATAHYALDLWVERWRRREEVGREFDPLTPHYPQTTC